MNFWKKWLQTDEGLLGCIAIGILSGVSTSLATWATEGPKIVLLIGLGIFFSLGPKSDRFGLIGFGGIVFGALGLGIQLLGWLFIPSLVHALGFGVAGLALGGVVFHLLSHQLIFRRNT